ncbi:hypothetical protein Tco_0638957 [Tanacetum coccineum]
MRWSKWRLSRGGCRGGSDGVGWCGNVVMMKVAGGEGVGCGGWWRWGDEGGGGVEMVNVVEWQRRGEMMTMVANAIGRWPESGRSGVEKDGGEGEVCVGG